MAVSISLHPLVLLNLSDQYTRRLADSGSKDRSFGVLVGLTKDRSIHIQNSFEAPSSFSEGHHTLDLGFIEQRLAMVLEIFPTYEFIGWYSTGEFSPADMEIQKTLMSVAEHLLYLNFNLSQTTSEEVLPVEVFETHVTVADNVTSHEFRKVPYSIETTDAERISVDFVSKKAAGAGEESQYVAEMQGNASAMRLLKKRLQLLLQIVEGDARVRADRRIMRKVNEICNRIPVVPAYNIEKEFDKEVSEELLVVLASAITKGSYALGELVERFHSINMAEA
jgi:COP9 signalosome complex subunit 6